MTQKKPVGKKTTTTVNKIEKTQEISTKESPVNIEYGPTDTVWTTSVTAGELGMIGKKSKTFYTWANLGDRTEIEYQDLLAEKARKGPYIFSPLFVIDDEDLLNSKGWENVKSVYQNMYSVEDLEAIFDLDFPSFTRTIENLPKGVINTVKTMAAEKIHNHTLDSLQKINYLDETLGTNLKLYI